MRQQIMTMMRAGMIAVCAAAGSSCAAGDAGWPAGGGVVMPSAVGLAGSADSIAAGARASSNYDGTGIWSQAPGCTHDCFYLDLVQDARGDLTLRDGFCAEVDCHVSIVLRRTGGRPKAGAISEYGVTIKGLPGDPRACINQQGTAAIDSSSAVNVMTVAVSGPNWQGAGCAPETGGVTLYR